MILDEIYEQSNRGKRYDRYLLICCPFHDDRNPSMLVYSDWYKCLSCGAIGKPITLLNQHSVIPIREKSKLLKNPFYSWLKGENLFPLLKTAYRVLKDCPDQRKYFRDRGLSDKTITNLKLGYREGYYLIPIIGKDGKLEGSLARAGASIQGARYFMPKGQPDLLYSPDWQMVSDAKEVWLTFGTIDAMSIYEVGKAAISTTSGKRVRPEWFSDIRKRINIFPDFGEEKEARQLASGLGWRGRVVKYRYPEFALDPNDLLRHNLLRSAIL